MNQETWRDVQLLSCAAFASATALRLCDPMLPALARDFETTSTAAAVVVTATSIAYGLCQLLFGPLGDRFGKFPVIALASLASTVGALACALSPSLWTLSLARALTGATTAALIPLSMAWIGDVVDLKDRQHTLARFMSGQIVGLISGQAIGGFFADTLGWRWAFVFLAMAYCLVGTLLWRRSRAMRTSIGCIEPSTHKSSFHASIAAVFNSSTAPMILFTVFIESLATFGVIAFIPSYLHERFGITLFHAGAVVAIFGLGGFLYTTVAQRWIHALGQPRLAMLGGCLLSLAFLMLALASFWQWAIVASFLAGLGFYQLHNTLQTEATQMTPQARGTAVSIFAACFFLGQAVGVSVGSWIIGNLSPTALFAISALILPLLGLSFGYRLLKRS